MEEFTDKDKVKMVDIYQVFRDENGKALIHPFGFRVHLTEDGSGRVGFAIKFNGQRYEVRTSGGTSFPPGYKAGETVVCIPDISNVVEEVKDLPGTFIRSELTSDDDIEEKKGN